MGIAETRMARGFSYELKKFPVIFPVIAKFASSESPGLR